MTSEQTTQKSVAGEQAFAAGDLGRVQGLLFGDQFDAINERIDALEAVLLDSVASIRTELRKEVGGTEKKIERTKQQLEKRLDAKVSKEAGARKEALIDLRAEASGGTVQLKNELAEKSVAFEKSLDGLKTATEKALASSRTALEKQIRSTEDALSDTKVDRNALADMLSQTAAQLSMTNEKASSKKVGKAA